MSTNESAGSDVGEGISERYRRAAAAVADVDVDLLPSRLATAAVQVCAADGAGLSVMSREFRVPLGASDSDAAAIERLQFTAGQGPCWDAIRADVPLAAGHDRIVRQWPEFAGELHRASRYRSIVSVPLRLARGTGGALDLYFEDPEGSGRFDPSKGTVIAAHVADLLNHCDRTTQPPELYGAAAPAWASGAGARGRLAVWIAVGMTMTEAGGLPEDGLAVLRAAAYSSGRSVDEVAADVTDGRTSVGRLLST